MAKSEVFTKLPKQKAYQSLKPTSSIPNLETVMRQFAATKICEDIFSYSFISHASKPITDYRLVKKKLCGTPGTSISHPNKHPKKHTSQKYYHYGQNFYKGLTKTSNSKGEKCGQQGKAEKIQRASHKGTFIAKIGIAQAESSGEYFGLVRILGLGNVGAGSGLDGAGWWIFSHGAQRNASSSGQT